MTRRGGGRVTLPPRPVTLVQRHVTLFARVVTRAARRVTLARHFVMPYRRHVTLRVTPHAETARMQELFV